MAVQNNNMSDLITNVNQVASDFNNIKQAIINKGVEVPQGTPTSEYGELINNISSSGSSVLPHSEGLAAYFDYSKNVSETGWTDIVGETTINAEFFLSEDFISTEQTSQNPTIQLIPNNPYTFYAIFKQNINNSAWSGILTNQTNSFGIFANQNKIAVYDPSTREGYTTDVSALNYHICAITFYNGLGSLYVDGVLKFTRTNINLANLPYYITYIGDYKMIALCDNVAHGSKYILENTQYLAEKYGIEI